MCQERKESGFRGQENTEVTNCDLKYGGVNGKEGKGADNGYYSCYIGD